MLTHTHIVVLIREHEGEANLHHDEQGMEIPYEWEKAYGEKVADSMSLKDRLKAKEQIVKKREAGREHEEQENSKKNQREM